MLCKKISQKACSKIESDHTDIIDSDDGVMTTNNESVTMRPQKQVLETTHQTHLGMTALVAIMEPATENASSMGSKLKSKCSPSNKISILIDTGSNGDIFFHKKEAHAFSLLDLADAKVLAYVK